MVKKNCRRGIRKACVSTQKELFLRQWKRRNEESVAFICLDVENWDGVPNSKKILELGVTVRPVVGVSFTTHYVVKENFHLVNRYCKTRPKCFMAGCGSIWLEFQAELRAVLDSVVSSLLRQYDVVCLTGYMVSSDLRFLSEGLEWVPPSSVEVVDVQALAESVCQYDNMPGLGMVSKSLGVQVSGFAEHNSGNDAFIAMEVMFAVAQLLEAEAEADFFEFM